MNKPLVLLHGWGVNSLIWNPILPQLENEFDVTVIDLPGYGNDVDYFADYSLEAITEEVLSRAPHKAIWVAWSLGTTIAMAAALAHPERFSKLQLISPTPQFLNGTDWDFGVELGPFKSLAEEFEQNYETAIKKFLLLQVLTNDRIQFRESRKLVRELTGLLVGSQRPSNRTLREGLNILSQTDLRPRLAELKVETQVIAGRNDHVVPVAASQFLFSQLENGHSFQDFNAGHLPFLEAPSKYIGALTSFTNPT